jgi:hypothetical protein
MARTRFDETDRLIIERWKEVAELMDAADGLKRKIRDFVDESQDHIQEWSKPRGFEAQCSGSSGEVHLYRPGWAKRDEPRMVLVFGGLTGKVIFETDGSKPYVSLYATGLKALGLDRASQERFRQELKNQLGDEFRKWDQDVDDEWLLTQYLPDVEGQTIRQALLGREAFIEFVTTQLERVIPLADVADAALRNSKTTSGSNAEA